MIVRGILLDEAEQLFLCLEASFMRWLGNDNMKTKYLLAFLKEVKYINKVINARVEYYTSKWAASLATTKYKIAINAAK